jgi:hypothetical protein
MFGAYYFGQPYFGQGPSDVPVVPTVLPSIDVDAAYTPILSIDAAAPVSITVDGYTVTFSLDGVVD